MNRATTEQRKQAKAGRSSGASARDRATEYASAKPIDVSSAYGRKIAVVIGISHYDRLSNPEGARRDAKQMATVLRTLGFDKV